MLMEMMSSVFGLMDDGTMTSRLGKSAVAKLGATLSDESAPTSGAFDAILAGAIPSQAVQPQAVASQAVAPQTILPQAAVQTVVPPQSAPQDSAVPSQALNLNPSQGLLGQDPAGVPTFVRTQAFASGVADKGAQAIPSDGTSPLAQFQGAIATDLPAASALDAQTTLGTQAATTSPSMPNTVASTGGVPALEAISGTGEALPAPSGDTAGIMTALKVADGTPSQIHAPEAATPSMPLTAVGSNTNPEVSKPDASPPSAVTLIAADRAPTGQVASAPSNQAQDNAIKVQQAALANQLGAAQPDQPANIVTNAATLAANRSNAGQMAALKSEAATTFSSEGSASSPQASTLTGSTSVNGGVVPRVAVVAKEAETPTQMAANSSTQAPDFASMSVESGEGMGVTANQGTPTPVADPAQRTPQLAPHSIPMLAATMMRRFDSGSRQFTMRLDPPELGKVDVKMTVGADKKVRAVVSADRPEALADLIRSARDLVGALREAGLDLDDNGLTFQMNDPSGGQHQGSGDHHGQHLASLSSNEIQALDPVSKDPLTHVAVANDPFQRWQRVRIALTV